MMEADFDALGLTRDLDRVKARVFMGRNAAFLGSVMCSLNMIWTQEVKTAAVDGINLFWNPDWFLKIPPETREMVLVHELWHIARMHLIRREQRDPEKWNWACDIRINNDLEDAGFTFAGTNPWKDQRFSGWVEEDIYDWLVDHPEYCMRGGSWGDDDDDDMLEAAATAAEILGIPIQAQHQARIAGEAGTIPGDIEEMIKQFLAPVIPWEVHLHKWFSDQLDTSYTWARPNRRYTELYLPSTFEDDGRLEHLIYFLDCSGSISHSQAVRFNSEVKYVKDMYNPAKMTLVLFDTVIQRVYEMTEEDPFDEIKIAGRGGTSLVCVRDYIEQHKPSAAIIFSDLEVAPMEPLSEPVPVLWVAIGNPSATVPFGDLIHIRG